MLIYSGFHECSLLSRDANVHLIILVKFALNKQADTIVRFAGALLKVTSRVFSRVLLEYTLR